MINLTIGLNKLLCSLFGHVKGKLEYDIQFNEFGKEIYHEKFICRRCGLNIPTKK